MRHELERLFGDIVKHMMVGDVDKPFHLPECCCQRCEEWRRQHGRPTYDELKKARALYDAHRSL